MMFLSLSYDHRVVDGALGGQFVRKVADYLESFDTNTKQSKHFKFFYYYESKIKKPIVFFDLETTGIQIAKDRIVEIAILKILPNGNKESKTWLVNPTIPIPAEITEIHGISNEMVTKKPTFLEIASEIMNLIKNCDLGGYNSNKFDIPLLAEEFLRAEIDLI